MHLHMHHSMLGTSYISIFHGAFLCARWRGMSRVGGSMGCWWNAHIEWFLWHDCIRRMRTFNEYTTAAVAVATPSICGRGVAAEEKQLMRTLLLPSDKKIIIFYICCFSKQTSRNFVRQNVAHIHTDAVKHVRIYLQMHRAEQTLSNTHAIWCRFGPGYGGIIRDLIHH